MAGEDGAEKDVRLRRKTRGPNLHRDPEGSDKQLYFFLPLSSSVCVCVKEIEREREPTKETVVLIHVANFITLFACLGLRSDA